MSVKFQKRLLLTMLCAAPVGLDAMNAALAEMMQKRAAQEAAKTGGASPAVPSMPTASADATPEDRVANVIAQQGEAIIATAKEQQLKAVAAFSVQKAFKSIYPDAPATADEIMQVRKKLDAMLNPSAKGATPTLPLPGQVTKPIKPTPIAVDENKKLSFKELNELTKAAIQSKLASFLAKVESDKATVSTMNFSTHKLIVPMQVEVVRMLNELQRVALKLQQQEQCMMDLVTEAQTSKIPNFAGSLAVLPRREGNESIAEPLKQLVKIFNDDTRDFGNIVALISKGDVAPTSPTGKQPKETKVPGATGGVTVPAKAVETTDTVFNAWLTPRKKISQELGVLVSQLDSAIKLKNVSKINELKQSMTSMQSLMNQTLDGVIKTLELKKLSPLSSAQERDAQALKLPEVQQTLQEKIEQCNLILAKVDAAFGSGSMVTPSTVSTSSAPAAKTSVASEVDRKREVARLQALLKQARAKADGEIGKVVVNKTQFRAESDNIRRKLLRAYSAKLQDVKQALVAGQITPPEAMQLSQKLQDVLVELTDSLVQSVT